MLSGSQLFDWRLLKMIDCSIIKDESVQVRSNHIEYLTSEGVPLLIEIDEIESLANGFEGFGEFRIKQSPDLSFTRCAITANRLGHFQNIFSDVVNPNEELYLDVCTDVVLADKTVLPRNDRFQHSSAIYQ